MKGRRRRQGSLSQLVSGARRSKGLTPADEPAARPGVGGPRSNGGPRRGRVACVAHGSPVLVHGGGGRLKGLLEESPRSAAAWGSRPAPTRPRGGRSARIRPRPHRRRGSGSRADPGHRVVELPVDEQPAWRELVGIVVQTHPPSLRTCVRYGLWGAPRPEEAGRRKPRSGLAMGVRPPGRPS
jgi:hypothetical protein